MLKTNSTPELNYNCIIYTHVDVWPYIEKKILLIPSFCEAFDEFIHHPKIQCAYMSSQKNTHTHIYTQNTIDDYVLKLILLKYANKFSEMKWNQIYYTSLFCDDKF